MPLFAHWKVWVQALIAELPKPLPRHQIRPSHDVRSGPSAYRCSATRKVGESKRPEGRPDQSWQASHLGSGRGSDCSGGTGAVGEGQVCEEVIFLYRVMSILSIFDSKLFSILASAVGSGGLLYFLIKKSLEKTIDSRFDARLEKVKHDLQLEHQRMSVVYEHQKDSFRKVLMAMHNATGAIASNVEGEGGDWLPITDDAANAFSQVFAEESLFMDGRSDHALRLFRQIM
jgi:hypothetical protein